MTIADSSELRTPLHQILAITQLLRSSMNDLADTPQALNTSSLTTTEQIRDLLPFLDAIDTSGKTLHGIVDNILSFLDLKGKDNMISPSSPSLLNSPSGVTQSLEVMFEEIIHEACEEDKRSRRANGQPMCHTETVFEIIPPLLGEQVTEDAGGALRRALSKILSNAYKFIEGEGCVQITVDDVEDLLPPVGCEDVSEVARYIEDLGLIAARFDQEDQDHDCRQWQGYGSCVREREAGRAVGEGRPLCDRQWSVRSQLTRDRSDLQVCRCTLRTASSTLWAVRWTSRRDPAKAALSTWRCLCPGGLSLLPLRPCSPTAPSSP